MKPLVDHDDHEETVAEGWARQARELRDHLEKYPDCIDAEERRVRAAMYESFAREALKHEQ